MNQLYTRITPPSRFSVFNFRKIWQYRELLVSFVVKDFKVLYVQTYLGYAWAVVNPLLTVLVLAFVFEAVGKVNTGAIPYVLFTLAGTSAWNFISNVANEISRSMVNSREIITKVYFPRLIIPLSKVVSGLVELGISLLCLFIFMVIYQFPLSSNFIFFPLFLVLVILTSLMVGLWVCTLSVLYRDFFFVIPFILRLGIFLTPVAYPMSAIPTEYQWILAVNPLSGAIEGLRWSILGNYELPSYVGVSISISLVLFILSFFYFKKIEHHIADIL
jgi:lipopolysaccharide transport system permease protein